jgi:hypothetical protein
LGLFPIVFINTFSFATRCKLRRCNFFNSGLFKQQILYGDFQSIANVKKYKKILILPPENSKHIDKKNINYEKTFTLVFNIAATAPAGSDESAKLHRDRRCRYNLLQFNASKHLL